MHRMNTITIQEFQRDAAHLLERVQAGERFIVTRDDRPVAELSPVATSRSGPRPYGLAAGQFKVPDDFDDPLPEEILQGFEGT